jgi:hypothetical protein
MLTLLLAISSSITFDAYTAVIYPRASVNATLSNGEHAIIFGAYFPESGSFELSEKEAASLAATTIFPSECREIIVSTRPTESLTLDHGTDPENPITDLCVWYVTRPARVTLTVRSGGDSVLHVENIDGVKAAQEISTGTVTYEIADSILVRWSNAPRELNSAASLKAIGRDNSIPYPNRAVQFKVSGQPYYFPASAIGPQARGLKAMGRRPEVE